jgi:hypothetical protein
VDRGQLEEASPFTTFQYLTVTFDTANTDFSIPHNLRPSNSEDIDYEVVRKDRAADVYHDQTGTRRAWGTGFIVLRCSTANAVVDLRLSIRRT